MTNQDPDDQHDVEQADKLIEKADKALKPCPFCGSSDVHIRLYNQPSVCCDKCLSMGPASERLTKHPDNTEQCKTQAAALWNGRIDHAILDLADTIDRDLEIPKQKGEPVERVRWQFLGSIMALRSEKEKTEQLEKELADCKYALLQRDEQLRKALAQHEADLQDLRQFVQAQKELVALQSACAAKDAALRHIIREASDAAYCLGYELSKRTECLGEKWKMENGKFGPEELKAHQAVAEQFGYHKLLNQDLLPRLESLLNREEGK